MSDESSTKWTKGKWIPTYADDSEDCQIDSEENARYVVNHYNVLIADCWPDTHLELGLPDSFQEAQANAWLVSAAPDLYASLESCLTYLPLNSEHRGTAMKALAKARGEE